MTLITHKVKGETVATFRLDDAGTATVAVFTCDELGSVLSQVIYAFMDKEAWTKKPEPFVRITHGGTRGSWKTSVRVAHVNGGVGQDFIWQGPEFKSGTRGSAAYRALIAFGGAITSGAVAEQREREADESMAITRALLAPVEREESVPAAPVKRKRRTRKGGDVIASTGLTLDAMQEAVAAHYAAGHPVPAEVSSLPDPTVTRAAMKGGSAVGSDDYRGCEGGGAHAAPNMERTHGKCPACHAYIPLLDTDADDDFRIGSHYEYGVKAPAIPASKRLASRSIENVEHGTIPGDAAAADKRRVAESRCVKSGKMSRRKSGGTHPCPTCERPVELVRKPTAEGDKWQIPNHVRPGDSFRRAGADGKTERKVTPRGKGADVGATARKGVGTPVVLSRGHGTVDGAANVGGTDLPAIQPTRGRLAVAGTMSLPATVRPGVDPQVEGEWCPVCEDVKWVAHRGKSKSWRRKHSTRVAAWCAAEDARREGRQSVERLLAVAAVRAELNTAAREGRKANAPAVAPSRPVRKAMRKSASIGRSAAGTLATTGTVVHTQPTLDAAE